MWQMRGLNTENTEIIWSRRCSTGILVHSFIDSSELLPPWWAGKCLGLKSWWDPAHGALYPEFTRHGNAFQHPACDCWARVKGERAVKYIDCMVDSRQYMTLKDKVIRAELSKFTHHLHHTTTFMFTFLVPFPFINVLCDHTLCSGGCRYQSFRAEFKDPINPDFRFSIYLMSCSAKCDMQGDVALLSCHSGAAVSQKGLVLSELWCMCCFHASPHTQSAFLCNLWIDV